MERVRRSSEETGDDSGSVRAADGAIHGARGHANGASAAESWLALGRSRFSSAQRGRKVFTVDDRARVLAMPQAAAGARVSVLRSTFEQQASDKAQHEG